MGSLHDVCVTITWWSKHYQMLGWWHKYNIVIYKLMVKHIRQLIVLHKIQPFIIYINIQKSVCTSSFLSLFIIYGMYDTVMVRWIIDILRPVKQPGTIQRCKWDRRMSIKTTNEDDLEKLSGITDNICTVL